MAITSENYNKLIASGKTPQQIQEAVNKQYGSNSNEAKAVTSFINSQTQTPEQAKTQGVNVLTAEQLKAKNTGTTTGTITGTTTGTITGTTTGTTKNVIQTPEQVKTQGVNVLTPEQLKAKNAGTTIISPTTNQNKKVTTDTNLSSLNKLQEKGYTNDQIKKALATKYGVDSKEYNKAIGFLTVDTEKKAKDEISNKDTTSNLGTDLLGKTTSEINKTKIETLGDQKTNDITNAWTNFAKSSDILKSNNSALLNLYGINSDGTVNMDNKDGLAYQIEKTRKDYEDLKNKTFKQLASTKYQGVVGKIRASLASRGIDASKIPEQQLIALSDSYGQAAFNDVYTAKENMINDIQTYNDNANTKINDLREKGLISQSEADKNIEALRQSTEAQISTINKEYANAIFGITETEATKSETEKSSTLNTITTLGTQLGLSGTSLGVLNNYVNTYKTPLEAYQAILKDLANTNSTLYKSIKNIETAKLAQQTFENQIALLKAEGSTTNSSTKFNAVQQVALSGLTGYDIKTVDDLQTLISSGKLSQNEINAVDSYLGGGISILQSDGEISDEKKKSE